MAKKKKDEDLPVFTIVELPEWKNRVLDLMLAVLGIPGQAWVIAVEDTGFDLTDDNYYTHRKTGVKIPKETKDNEEDAV
jgi:hypothetical protein